MLYCRQLVSVSGRCFTSDPRGFFSSKWIGAGWLLNSVWECPYSFYWQWLPKWLLSCCYFHTRPLFFWKGRAGHLKARGFCVQSQWLTHVSWLRWFPLGTLASSHSPKTCKWNRNVMFLLDLKCQVFRYSSLTPHDIKSLVLILRDVKVLKYKTFFLHPLKQHGHFIKQWLILRKKRWKKRLAWTRRERVCT